MITKIPPVLLLFLLLCCVYEVQGQQNEIDSLIRSLPPAEDTTRVNALNDLAYKVMFNAPGQGEKYARESAGLAMRLHFHKGIAKAYNMMGMSHDLRGNYALAIDAYDEGLAALQQSGVNNDKAYTALYNGLGLIYSRKADYPKALDYFFKSLVLAEKTKNRSTQVSVLLNIGGVYADQKDYDRALEYYFKCRDEAAAGSEKKVVAKAINNIGIVYLHTERYDEAIRHFLISLEYKKQIGDTLAISTSLTNLADVYRKQKNYAKALEHLEQAEILKRKVDDQWGLVSVNDIRASIYIVQNKLAHAAALIHQNAGMVNRLGSGNKSLVYERLHDLYKAKNDYKSALYWYTRNTQYADSIFNETKSQQLAELHTLYEVNKKEKEIIRLEKEREEERFAKNIMIISLVSLAVIVFCVLYFLRFRIKKKHQLHQIALELYQKKAENASLREKELQREIEFKNRELASYTINFVQKSELMEELKRNLQSIQSSDSDVTKKIAGINKMVETSYQVDREWEDFKMQFENVHTNFFRQLKDRCPELTNGDLKLCALLKLNMNMKEAAKILGISPESVKTARYRLRKKFGLSQDDNLVDFVLKIENENAEKVKMSA